MKRVSGFYKRMLAVLLAAALVVSSFTGMSFSVYAAEAAASGETGSEEAVSTEDAVETDVSTETETPAEADVPTEADTPTEDVPEGTETPSEEESGDGDTDVVPKEEDTEEVPLEGETTETIEDTVSDNEAEPLTLINDTEGEEEYLGEEYDDEDGRHVLLITQWDFEEWEKEKPFGETVVTVLAARRGEKKTYDMVDIQYSEMPDSVKKSVWDEACAIVAGDGILRFVYPVGKGVTTDDGTEYYEHQWWEFKNPHETETSADVNIQYTMTIKGAGEGADVTFPSVSFPAEEAVPGYCTNQRDNTSYEKVTKAFGEEDTKAALFHAQDGIQSQECFYSIWEENAEEGEILHANISMGNIMDSGFTVSTKYLLKAAPYDVNTWGDDEWSGLDINLWEESADAFAAADIAKIVGSVKYDEVSINYPYALGDGKEIKKELLNAAAEALNEVGNPDEEERLVKFGFYDEASNPSVEWRIINPTGSQAEDVAVAAVLTLDTAAKKATVTATAAGFDAERVDVGFRYEAGSAGEKDVKTIFGNESAELLIWNKEVSGEGASYEDYRGQYDADGDKDENGNLNAVWVRVNWVQNFDPDKVYTVEKWRYGDAWYDENEVAELRLSYTQFGDGRAITLDQLKDCFAYYKERGWTFREIWIEQPYGTTNIIKKEFINAAVDMLDAYEPSEERVPRLAFTFCRCQHNENETDTQDDINWYLENPGTAASDIDATLTLTPLAGQGVKVKLKKANTYNADDVWVQFYTDPDSTTAKGLEAALGEPQENEDGVDTSLTVLKKDVEVADSYSWAHYAKNVRDDGSYAVELGTSVRSWAAATDYRLVKATEMEEFKSGEIPQEFKAVKDITGATSFVWKSLNTDVATVDNTGKVTIINNGEVYFTVSYKIGKAAYFEVYRAWVGIPLASISFQTSEYTMELPEEAGQEARYRLDVKYMPSNADVDRDPANLKWSIEVLEGEEGVVELVPEGDDNDNEKQIRGEIKAVKAGKAVVRAEYIDGKDEEGKDIVLAYATCTITVKEGVKLPDGLEDKLYGNEKHWGEVYVVTNYDTTLADAVLPQDESDAEEKWTLEWKYPTTKLTSFTGMFDHWFDAVYKAPDGRTLDLRVPVRMVTITGMEIVALDEKGRTDDSDGTIPIPLAMENGKTVILNCWIDVENGTVDEIGLKDNSEESSSEDKGRLVVAWTASPNGTKIVKCEEDEEVNGWRESYKFTAEAGAKAAKKTFTVSLQDTKNRNKVIAKDSVSITVVTKSVIDFNEMTPSVESLRNAQPGDTGEITFTLPDDQYKLTVKSSDASVVKLGKVRTQTNDDKSVTTIIPYEVKKFGTIKLTATANDEIKSSVSNDITIVDRVPKALEKSFTIDKNYDGAYAPITFSFMGDYGMADGEITLEDVAGARTPVANKFDISGEYNDELGLYTGEISLKKDITIAKGTYKLIAQVPVDISADDGVITTRSYDIPVTVKVVQTTPSVTFKQTKKINMFYTDGAEFEGLLTVGAGSLEVTALDIDGASKFALVDDPDNGGVYSLTLIDWEDTLTNADKRITLEYTVEDPADPAKGTYTGKKNFTVAVENTAPKLVTAPGSTTTLYPNHDVNEVKVALVKKTAAGESPVSMTHLEFISWVIAKKSGKTEEDVEDIWENPENPAMRELKKSNTYALFSCSREEYDDAAYINIALNTNKKANADKITLRMKEDNWSKPIEVTYTIKVDVNAPKIQLSKSKLTLNKNDTMYHDRALYMSQTDDTRITFAGGTILFNGEVRFTGNDAKSQEILNKELQLEYWDQERIIVARLNTDETTNKKLQTGTYKYKVWAKGCGQTYSATALLTINITDKKPEQCVKVTKKGAIDVLQRVYWEEDEDGNDNMIMEATACITYAPKLSNIPGRVIDGYMEGGDANMFAARWNKEKGLLEVGACEGAPLSTKHTYKIRPVFVVEMFDGSTNDVPAAEQSVKVTQGKAKVTITPVNTDILYRQAGKDNAKVDLNLRAVLKNKDIEVEDVYLMNYTDDLVLEEYPHESEDGVSYCTGISDEGVITIRPCRDDNGNQIMKQITTTGKTWTLKFGVRYRDKAGDQKNTEVSYKIVIQ